MRTVYSDTWTVNFILILRLLNIYAPALTMSVLFKTYFICSFISVKNLNNFIV